MNVSVGLEFLDACSSFSMMSSSMIILLEERIFQMFSAVVSWPEWSFC